MSESVHFKSSRIKISLLLHRYSLDGPTDCAESPCGPHGACVDSASSWDRDWLALQQAYSSDTALAFACTDSARMNLLSADQFCIGILYCLLCLLIKGALIHRSRQLSARLVRQAL